MKRVLNFAFSSLLKIGVCVAIYFSFGKFGEGSIWLPILFCGVGYFVGNFFYTFFHELGHLIGGKIAGFEFYSFCVLFLKFIKINGKLRLRLTFSKQIAGYCQMIPKTTENLEKSFYTFVNGAFVLSWIFLISSFAFVFAPYAFPQLFVGGSSIYFLVAPFFLSALPMHQNNFSDVSVNPSSDGEIMRGIKRKSPLSVIQIKLLALQALLLSGVRPRDLDPAYFENILFSADSISYEPLFESYKLSYLLDKKDYAEVINSSDRLKVIGTKAMEVFHNLLLCDVFYVELVLKKDMEEAEKYTYRAMKIINSQTDISSLRIRMAKEIYIDKNYSKALNTAVIAKNMFEKYIFRGAAEMEYEIIDELSKIASQKKKEEFDAMDVEFVQYQG